MPEVRVGLARRPSPLGVVVSSTLRIERRPPEEASAMAHGFTGKILHVDLTEGRHWVEEPDDAFYRKMMGGRALVAHYLLTLVPPGADPFGPENLFIMAPGIVTGSTLSGQGRNGVGAKS